MNLPAWQTFLSAVPTLILSCWYLVRATRENRYEGVTFAVAVAYGMILEVTSIKTVHEYGYANLWFMLGSLPDWVPWSVGFGWASMVYVGMKTSDAVGLPWYQRPLLDGAVAVAIDLVLDPAASNTRWVPADAQACLLQNSPTFGGIGAWTWCVPEGTTGFWYSVPIGNFLGWFVIVACLSFCVRLVQQKLRGAERGLLAQVALVALAAGVSLGAVYVLLGLSGLAKAAGTVQWTVFGACLAAPVLLVIAQRAKLSFNQPVAWGLVVWPLYMYGVWTALFIALRIDAESWPLAPIGIVLTAIGGLLLLFLPNLGRLRAARSH